MFPSGFKKNRLAAIVKSINVGYISMVAGLALARNCISPQAPIGKIPLAKRHGSTTAPAAAGDFHTGHAMGLRRVTST
jgi:hypothetical protein